MSAKSDAGFKFVPDPARRAEIHALYDNAKLQATFGARLLAAGVQEWSYDAGTGLASPQAIASQAIIDDENEVAGTIWSSTAQGLIAALNGYADLPSMPEYLWSELTSGKDKSAMTSWLRDKNGNSVQAWMQDYTRSTADLLNEVASNDPAAADLMANMIQDRQKLYADEYVNMLAASFAKQTWRGGVKALAAIAEAAGEVVGAGFQGIADKASFSGLILMAVLVGGIALYKFGLPEMGTETRSGRAYAAVKKARDRVRRGVDAARKDD